MRVEIKSSAFGVGWIKVDGADLSHVVAAVGVQIRAMEPCRVTLELAPCEVTLDAETKAKLVELQRQTNGEKL